MSHSVLPWGSCRQVEVARSLEARRFRRRRPKAAETGSRLPTPAAGRGAAKETENRRKTDQAYFLIVVLQLELRGAEPSRAGN